MTLLANVRLLGLEIERVIAARQETHLRRLLAAVDEHDVGLVLLGERHGLVEGHLGIAVRQVDLV